MISGKTTIEISSSPTPMVGVEIKAVIYVRNTDCTEEEYIKTINDARKQMNAELDVQMGFTSRYAI